MRSMRWTDTDTALLTEQYPELGRTQELYALFPGCTPKAVHLKANALGLHVKNASSRKLRTNAEYVSLLKGTGFTALEVYKGSQIPILHECQACSHQWSTRPNNILQGQGCPVCADVERYWDTDQSLLELYLVKVAMGTEHFLKVGVSSCIKDRIHRLKSHIGGNAEIELLHTASHTPHKALLLERKILAQYIKYISLVKFNGHTELLSLDNDIEEIKQTMEGTNNE